ncbi:DUF1491 family protein [Phyllobacterium sp. 21LDTY02-6]|uniref:DUF1491 family protein n=1 Tax=Phyllobacterium sp. 21LDTY02-6 TaxID=2944903 RepID=UPI0020219AEF|nr:DUF1491 family protein [Phyllobacterium sp. 21LDTY02-6]MCO4318367.1 DUF1491 family protein [Phyllobacterium sp. 21LDTY02-6]
MRLTSEFWVAALVRRVNDSGAFAALGNKGAAEAGAIFIKFRNKDGSYDLFGPAPQLAYDERKPDERIFVLVKTGVAEMEVDDELQRQMRWDRDLWIVEIEDYRAARDDLFPVTDLEY